MADEALAGAIEASDAFTMPEGMQVTSSDQPAADEATTVDAKVDNKDTPAPKPRVQAEGDGGYQLWRGEEKIVLTKDEAAQIARMRVGESRRDARVAREEAEATKAELERERGRASQLEHDLADARKGKPAETEKPWTAKGAPKPKLDDFDTVDEWDDAKDDWRAAQSAEPSPTLDVTPEQRAANEAFGARVRDVMSDGAERYTDFKDVTGPAQVTQEAFSAILDSEFAADLMYELGKNPDALQELNSLSGRALDRALFRIETRIETAANTASDDDLPGEGVAAPKKPAREQKPLATITPVRPGATPRKSLADLAKSDDLTGFFSATDEMGIR